MKDTRESTICIHLIEISILRLLTRDEIGPIARTGHFAHFNEWGAISPCPQCRTDASSLRTMSPLQSHSQVHVCITNDETSLAVLPRVQALGIVVVHHSNQHHWHLQHAV
jgi:hypothetical protein